MTILRALRRLDDALIPRGAVRRVLLDARTPMNFEMMAPVLQALSLDDRITFACTASEEPHRIDDIYRLAPPALPRVHPKRAALAKWDVCMSSDFVWATLPRGARRVQMFHGVAGKYNFDAPTDAMRGWDRFFFVNRRRLTNFVRSGVLSADSGAARLVGMPKLDGLVDGSLQREQILTAHGLDPARPTILYAPTWSPASSLNCMGTEVIGALLRRPYNLLVKLHDRSFDRRAEYSGGIDWATRLSALLPQDRALLVRAPNITPYLAAADVMITDHSSAGFEYLLLDRPLVRIELPELLRLASVHPDYVQLLAEVSHTTRTADGVLQAVERALGEPGVHSVARRRVAAELFFQPGTASVRAARELSELLELPAHESLAEREQKAQACLQMA